MPRTLQLLLYETYKRDVSQITKNTIQTYLLGGWSLPITYMITSICKFYVVKLVVSLSFFYKNKKIKKKEAKVQTKEYKLPSELK